MATKAKTEPASKSTSAPSHPAPSALAVAFSKAVKLVDSGKFPEAAKALETLRDEAQAAGEWSMKRRAQVYLSLANEKIHPPKAVAPDAITEIQACLNRHETDEALKLSEKAIKSHPTKGALHYLRAVAFAQNENTEAAAESLKKAVELEADFVFQWHMEPDFNPIRKSPLFAFTEGR
ncbi:MAG: tetratricopeptide repeat protein [Geothrix sp.]|uniref:TPR end-of-group domain-containing protein n=1 Tax=Geothrix sp. TaxID=1962974 RepID=UPI0017C9C74E|nr:tetratricopeptide repeat protein [Geothrix sp.]NWJ42464.1 tetratricopeptide repeat protein [Geothrix sp.]WIL19573.1 MAG: tetratricopeptide repeat protein [Geothrix sp.]